MDRLVEFQGAPHVALGGGGTDVAVLVGADRGVGGNQDAGDMPGVPGRVDGPGDKRPPRATLFRGGPLGKQSVREQVAKILGYPPTDFIKPRWQKLVMSNAGIDRPIQSALLLRDCYT